MSNLFPVIYSISESMCDGNYFEFHLIRRLVCAVRAGGYAPPKVSIMLRSNIVLLFFLSKNELNSSKFIVNRFKTYR